MSWSFGWCERRQRLHTYDINDENTEFDRYRAARVLALESNVVLVKLMSEVAHLGDNFET